jgi:GT2 family glycosyltransferase
LSSDVTLSVTIVNHSAEAELRRCLEAVQRSPHTLGPMEVVVIDNASDDRSVSMVRGEFPDTVVVAKQSRRGFGANQNDAVSIARGELIMMLNPDVIVHERTIDRLAAAIGFADDIAAAGGPSYESDGSPRQNRPFSPPSAWERTAKALGIRKLLRRRRDSMEDHLFKKGWLSGGALVVKRSAFELVGGFDEDFFMYGEDADLFARLAQRGYRFAWVADAVVTHPHPHEDPISSGRRATEAVRGELRYAQKHAGRLGALAYRGAVIVDSALRLAALSLPGVRRTVRLHGTSAEDQRAIHRTRLAVAVGAKRSGLAEVAADWNRRHPSTAA